LRVAWDLVRIRFVHGGIPKIAAEIAAVPGSPDSGSTRRAPKP
jgi:hypothetical protein